jgi:hypothetical protein
VAGRHTYGSFFPAAANDKTFLEQLVQVTADGSFRELEIVAELVRGARLALLFERAEHMCSVGVRPHLLGAFDRLEVVLAEFHVELFWG